MVWKLFVLWLLVAVVTSSPRECGESFREMCKEANAGVYPSSGARATLLANLNEYCRRRLTECLSQNSNPNTRHQSGQLNSNVFMASRG
ncbi:hypothetical protein PHET_05198 [Paragonimus heterotremus]|uniref:Uncharacterized protein n=1 Tax=Paragonimus heterotremus TaxID=100268 RepID=A0A8J4X064_9TREM|nr:hypothetical protein PHET_05198 [Paragonimus heterotremus]